MISRKLKIFKNLLQRIGVNIKCQDLNNNILTIKYLQYPAKIYYTL